MVKCCLCKSANAVSKLFLDVKSLKYSPTTNYIFIMWTTGLRPRICFDIKYNNEVVIVKLFKLPTLWNNHGKNVQALWLRDVLQSVVSSKSSCIQELMTLIDHFLCQPVECEETMQIWISCNLTKLGSLPTRLLRLFTFREPRAM